MITCCGFVESMVDIAEVRGLIFEMPTPNIPSFRASRIYFISEPMLCLYRRSGRPAVRLK